MNPTIPAIVGPRRVTIEIPPLPDLFFFVSFCINDRTKGGYWSTSIIYNTPERRDEAMLRADCLCAYPVDLPAQPLIQPITKPHGPCECEGIACDVCNPSTPTSTKTFAPCAHCGVDSCEGKGCVGP